MIATAIEYRAPQDLYMAILAATGNRELAAAYDTDPTGLLDFVALCQMLGRAHLHHAAEQPLQEASNVLERALSLSREAAHLIRRHCRA